MKTNELLQMLKTAEQLGQKDLEIFLYSGRDGFSGYTKVEMVFDTRKEKGT